MCDCEEGYEECSCCEGLGWISPDSYIDGEIEEDQVKIECIDCGGSGCIEE